MRLSHEKVVQLSHRIMSAVDEVEEVEIFDHSNAIRQEVVKILTDLLHEEEKIETAARLRITSQKRTIPEGGAEWDILFRKYYSDELRKLAGAIPSKSRP